MAISYYDEDGRITGEMTGDAAAVNLTKQLTTQPWVDGLLFNKNMYVLNGKAVARPDNPTTVSGQTLDNVPTPATIIINGTSYDINESRVELGFSQPGTYDVKVVAWPYLDKEFSVENSA
jgi:hypothetical protein